MGLGNNTYNINRQIKLFRILYSGFALFAGLFLGTFDIIVHALFFKNFGYHQLASSYVLSGLLGLLLSFLLTVLARRVSTRTLVNTNITFSLLLAGVYLVGVSQFPNNRIVYAGMVVFFPVNMLIILSIWRYGRMLLTQKNTKEAFPKIKMAHFLGLATGGASFTVVLYFLQFEHLIYTAIGTLGILVILLLLLHIASRKSPVHIKDAVKYVPFKNKLLLFYGSSFTAYLILFSTFSAIVGFSLHFAFMNAAWAGFFNIEGMSKFYGLFISSAMIFTIVFDRYIIKRVLYAYDSPYSLVLLPPLLFAALAISILGFFLLGNIQPHEHFTLFFILLAIAKIGYISSQFSIQSPSLRTLYHSLDVRFRQVVYSRVEGGATMVGLAIAGGVILGLSYLKFYSPIIILVFLAVVIVLWMLITIKLIKEYRLSQDKILAKLRFSKASSQYKGSFPERVREILAKNDKEKIIEALKLIKLHKPLEYESNLKQLLSHPSAKVRTYALGCITRDKIDSTLPKLNELAARLPESEREEVEQVIQSFGEGDYMAVSKNTIKQKVFTGTDKEKVDLAFIIAQSDLKDKESLLTFLSKDQDIKVRNAAVKALARNASKNFNYSLLDFLYPEQFEPYALDAIAATGDSAIDFLERESMIPGANNLVIARIMRLYGRISTTRSINHLLGKLGTLNNYVMVHSLQALTEQRFQASKSNKLKIQNLIVKLVADLTYNLNTHNNLSRKKGYAPLFQAYQYEIQLNYQKLFELLGLLYNPNIIHSLRNLFLQGSRAQISHGLELADQYLDTDLKPLLFPLFEDISDNERIRKLELYFPQTKQKPLEIISNTLTQDYNKLSMYTRAIGMLMINDLNLKGFEHELIFNASHSEKMLNETALFVLQNVYRKNYEEFRGILTRQEWLKYKTDALVENNREQLLLSRYSRLLQNRAFHGLGEYVIVGLASTARELVLEKGQSLNLDRITSKYSVILFEKNVTFNNNKQVSIVPSLFLPLDLLINKGITKFNAYSATRVWLFEKKVIEALIFDNIDLANTILYGINKFKINNN